MPTDLNNYFVACNGMLCYDNNQNPFDPYDPPSAEPIIHIREIEAILYAAKERFPDGYSIEDIVSLIKAGRPILTPCPRCNGEGGYWTENLELREPTEEWEKCPICLGVGELGKMPIGLPGVSRN